ncbi:LysE family translocator [Francisella tularensis subsp. novicida]|uniref:LysE family translocator n=2 Tax=Francisella tularensis TaxID=263 RepID=A0A6I4RQC9_FRATU|nr:LysE family translocator [Francisella tularensis]ABK90271.1 homoserine/threonine efflux family protein [Francisella tularensis subsp. novicida U112]AJI45270.1 lysE type translocator family protein [Francisella tularensis subsp. novicida F6168]AJI61502.1 lysE type translocator family protein [Francisella tularensis subsp. novicida U112]AJJ47741.1 lysE type translocator family protein [Francisella tularensis subsp. novicida]APC99259.1 lysE type translocator family protein [Francisella tularen
MLIFLTILALQISCLILPGPDFFVTISNSIKFGHKSGIYTASGVASGIFLNTFIVYWFGSLLLYKQPLLFKMLIIIGAAYLAYIAFSLYKSIFTKQQLNPNANQHIKNLDNFDKPSNTKLFLNGAFTNLANAKVLVFFSSMLSLVDELNSFGKVAIWIAIALTTLVWFCIVATFFGNDKLRQVFFRNIKKIEFISAIFITIFVIVILVELF